MDNNIIKDGNAITQMSLKDLRREWEKLWGKKPHTRMGRKMLEHSIAYKWREHRGEGLTSEQQKRLEKLVRAYKRNPQYFKEGLNNIKPGMRLVKKYQGIEHNVLVLDRGFQYQNKIYSSLSELATEITGTRWNGWVFFGLKKRKG